MTVGAEFRGTRCYVARDANRKGRLCSETATSSLVPVVRLAEAPTEPTGPTPSQPAPTQAATERIATTTLEDLTEVRARLRNETRVPRGSFELAGGGELGSASVGLFVPDGLLAADALREEVDEGSDLGGQVASFGPDGVDVLRWHAVVAKQRHQSTFGEVGTNDERGYSADARPL